MSPGRSAIDLLVGQSMRRTEPTAAARNGSSPVPAARIRTGDEVQVRSPAFRMPPLTREDVRFAPDFAGGGRWIRTFGSARDRTSFAMSRRQLGAALRTSCVQTGAAGVAAVQLDLFCSANHSTEPGAGRD